MLKCDISSIYESFNHEHSFLYLFIYFIALPHHKTQKLELYWPTLKSTTGESRYAVLSSTAINLWPHSPPQLQAHGQTLTRGTGRAWNICIFEVLIIECHRHDQEELMHLTAGLDSRGGKVTRQTRLLIQPFCTDKPIICIFRFWTPDPSVSVRGKGQLLWRVIVRSQLLRQAVVATVSHSNVYTSMCTTAAQCVPSNVGNTYNSQVLHHCCPSGAHEGVKWNYCSWDKQIFWGVSVNVLASFSQLRRDIHHSDSKVIRPKPWPSVYVVGDVVRRLSQSQRGVNDKTFLTRCLSAVFTQFSHHEEHALSVICAHLASLQFW